MSYWNRTLIFLFSAVLFCSVPAFAQYSAEKPLGSNAQSLPGYLKHAGIEQRLDQPLPLQAEFTDSTGQTVPLGNFFGKRPVVMALVYFKCAMLCPQVQHGLAAVLKQVSFKPGKDYDVLITSFDPTDTPADAASEKQHFLAMLGNPGAANGVHYLVGKQASIDALAAATGFHYVRVPGPDGQMTQFAHSSVIMFATPDGRMSKYLSGIDYQERDVRLALVDASAHKIGNAADLFLLYCCSYNPAVGKYTVSILRVLSIAAMFSILALIGMIFLVTRKPKSMQQS
ncbi:MAG: SCO family protein [Acidobacteriaceae bacterium]